jgi:uncharacterized protein
VTLKRLCTAFIMALFVAGCQTSPPHTPSVATISPIDYLPALKGDYFRLDAQKIGRPFHIFVGYPEGYDSAKPKRYPTVYVLDGDSLFPMIAPHQLFLQYDDKLPEAIIVGIAYGGFGPEVNKRGYDYSMPAPEADADQGGAPVFHAFIKDELIPQIEKRYRSDPDRRILIGQSRGGHFVLFSAMTEPDLFWGRIASSPGLTPGEDFMSNGIPAKASRKDLKLMVFSGSDDRSESRSRALAWNKAWEARRDAPWQRWFLNMPGATHAANITDAYRAGMRWFFDYQAPKADALNY